jgi:DNA (cytosine-5)-methyltransferase 1
MPAATWERRPSGLLVPLSPPRHRDKPIAIGFFSGCGGLDLGFMQAGWHVAAAVEMDLVAACTYLVNLGGPGTIVHKQDGDHWLRKVAGPPDNAMPEAGTGYLTADRQGCPAECRCAGCVKAIPCEHFWIGDVRHITGQQILDELSMQPGDIEAVIGGPPCQGFSAAGKRDVMDPRNSLVFEFARLIVEIRPKTFVMENVPGILSMHTPEGLPVIDAFCQVIADGGFSTYDALKRALKQQAGSFAALRNDENHNPKTREPAPAQAPTNDQLDLFDQGGST